MSTITDGLKAPFDSVGNIFSGKGNLGDLFNIGSVFAPGGNLLGSGLKGLGTANLGTSSILGAAGLSGLGNPAKWTIGDGVRAAGLLGGLHGRPSGDIQNPNYSGANMGAGGINGLAGGYGPLAGNELAWLAGNQNRGYGYVNDASRLLDPANYGAMISAFGNRAQGSAVSSGIAQGEALRQRGYGTGMQDAGLLNAQNQANVATGNYSQALMDPANRAQAYLGLAGILSPGNSPALRQASGLYGQAYGIGAGERFYDNNGRPATPLEQNTSIWGKIAPYMGSQGASGFRDPGMSVPSTHGGGNAPFGGGSSSGGNNQSLLNGISGWNWNPSISGNPGGFMGGGW